MGRIPDRVIEEIRERADIVQVVSRQVSLRKRGSGYLGLCPFHTENTPSFHVHPERQIYHCFGCGEGGDVFGFRMRHDGADFLDTVRSLAREFGVTIPETGGRDESRTAPLYKLNDLALGYFRQSLRSQGGAAARAYLERRGVPRDLVDRFQLGFAPPGWDGLLDELRRQGESVARAEEASLVVARQTGDGHYDRFRGRLIFPIIEATGRVVGFGGRGLADETPKYLNSSESPIYRKGRALFGLSLAVDAIRRKRRAIVVEGYFDLIALHRAGFEEGVAPCGTALTPDHARRLRRYTRDVIMLFDGDEAGQRAAERSLPVLAGAGLRVRAAFLPEGEDPDTLLEKSGEAALVDCIDGAVPLIEHLIDERLGMQRPNGWQGSEITQSFGPLLAVVPDPIERDSYKRRIASRLELAPAIVLRALEDTHARPASPPEPVEVRRPAEIDAPVRMLVGALAAHPELAERVAELRSEELPQGQSGVLLASVLEALREHGSGAVARLTSPLAEELPPELKSALSQAVAGSTPGDRATAERAVADCVASLRVRVLEAELRSVRLRLESCTDPAEKDRLFLRVHEITRERGALHSPMSEGLTLSSQ